MNKTILAAVLLSLLPLVSCTQKKDQLSADTLTIAVDPSTAQSAVIGGTPLTLRAICRSAKSDSVDVNPAWTVENNLGSFSPSSGRSTTFTPSAVGTGKIYAAYGGIRGEVAVTVSSTSGPTPPPPPPPSSTIYGIYSETYVSPTYSMLKFDTANPPDVDGGCIGQYADASISASLTDKTEGSESTKCILTSGVGWGGWWIQFGSDNTPGFNSDARVAKDMSTFSGGSLKFDVKTPQNLKITIESGDVGSASTVFVWLSDISVPLDNSWHSVSIPLSSFGGGTLTLAKVQVPAGFNAGTSNFTFYIDNVRWEK